MIDVFEINNLRPPITSVLFFFLFGDFVDTYRSCFNHACDVKECLVGKKKKKSDAQILNL